MYITKIRLFCKFEYLHNFNNRYSFEYSSDSSLVVSLTHKYLESHIGLLIDIQDLAFRSDNLCWIQSVTINPE